MRKQLIYAGAILAPLGAVGLGTVGLGAVSAAPPVSGAAVFAENCAACHQAQGQGVPGAFPKLAGDAIVRGPAPALAYLLTHGRGGMPSFANDLTDDKIAAVLTYIRSSWGNRAPPVTAAQVAAARKGVVKEEKSVLPYH